jgi:hypothetical protein
LSKISTGKRGVGGSEEILFLSSTLLSEIVKKEKDCQNLFIEKDPFCFDLVIIPFEYENRWILIILDNRNMVAKKGFSFLRYYSLVHSVSIPFFVNDVRLFLISNYLRRYSTNDKRSISLPKVLMKYDLFDDFPNHHDLFVCCVARSFVSGKSFDKNSAQITDLKDKLISDFELFEGGAL